MGFLSVGRNLVTGTLLGVSLGGVPAAAKAQGSAHVQGIENIDPKMEKQIIAAREIIQDMWRNGSSQKEIEKEIQRLTREIVGEKEKMILFRGNPMPLWTAVLFLVTGTAGVWKINRDNRGRTYASEDKVTPGARLALQGGAGRNDKGREPHTSCL